MQNPAVPVDVDELIMGTFDADTTPEGQQRGLTPEGQRLEVGLGVGVGVGVEEDSPRSPPSGVHAMYVPRSPPSFSRGNHIPASGIATPPSLSSQCSSRSSRSSRKHYDQSSSPRTPTHPSQNSQSNLSRPSQIAQSNDRARTETLEDWAIADFAALVDEDAQHTLTTGKISEITLSMMNTLSRKHTLFYEQINEQNLNNYHQQINMKAGADDGAGFLSRWGGYVNMGEYVSSVSMPEMSMPDMSMPDMSMPEMSIPEMSMPEMSMPEMSMPSYEISMSLPDMPSVSMPEMSMGEYVPSMPSVPGEISTYSNPKPNLSFTIRIIPN